MTSKDLAIKASKAYDAQYRDLKAVSVAKLAVLDAEEASKRSKAIYDKYRRVAELTAEVEKLEKENG